MATAQPQPILRADYRPPEWLVPQIDLVLVLDPSRTRVDATLHIAANPQRPDRGVLALDGEHQKLVSVEIDGRALTPSDYQLNEDRLSIPAPSEQFQVRIVSELVPERNSALEGLYLSGATLTTQCEAEGFRRITYFPDRPDILTVYHTRLEADEKRYPCLLSNGNCISQGKLDGGRHFAQWHDPFPKPCYLFAVVAGDLARLEDRFITQSGRIVTLYLYVEHGNQPRAAFALQALKRAMLWDEQVFGLEYDLDTFQIVAVSDFNMGAMENKGLNIFNAKYILADSETATDQDYANIEAVVAHEYFHNWTGNRITCRDWFQLALKEGLTVFRDQQFQADMRGAAIKRIADVRTLRSQQFPEDAGPLAHPVRPDRYIEVNNFYTATIYEKGAEIVRMLHRILGSEGFRRGMDFYVAHYDGKAAAIDDFVDAMERANDRDFSLFRLWYSQSGTPALSAQWRQSGSELKLTLGQATKPTPDQPDKHALHVPVAVGLLGPTGESIPVLLAGEPSNNASSTRLLELTEAQTDYHFVNVPSGAVPSLLRGFSAPCKVIYRDPLSVSRFLMRHDRDAFNRWDACQDFSLTLMLRLSRGENAPGDIAALGEALADTLADKNLDHAFKAAMLTLPGERDVAQRADIIYVEPICTARAQVLSKLADQLYDILIETYEGLEIIEPYAPNPEQSAQRALRSAALRLLCARKRAPDIARISRHFDLATNMTDQVAGLTILADCPGPEREHALGRFYKRHRSDPLVVDKWFAIQAGSSLPTVRQDVEHLARHGAFTLKNPNKIRALLGTFAHNNLSGFHEQGGAGYYFIADQILAIDARNPQAAARLLTAFEAWRRFEPVRSAAMKDALMRVVKSPSPSPNLAEIAARLLGTG